MKELSKRGWCECSNGQHYFHSCDFDVMRTIGNLVHHVERLKNKHIHSTLREIVPECVPSEKNVQKNDKQEDEDDRTYDRLRGHAEELSLCRILRGIAVEHVPSE